MNRWNIDILDIQMQEQTRKKILADSNLRKRLQDELDRRLPIEFENQAYPDLGYCSVKDFGKPYLDID